MILAETYLSLARMLDYPAEKEGLQTARAAVSDCLDERHVDCPLGAFADLVASSSLTSLQEEYVATFDFNPATAPYLGHHLFGDNQKKGGYLIGLKQEFGRYGFVPPGNELPDHVSVVLGFLAHLARKKSDAARKTFIAVSVLPGIERLCAVFADRQGSPWRPVVEAARLLCAADCKEVAHAE
jgi:nitrate reductase delta subunit